MTSMPHRAQALAGVTALLASAALVATGLPARAAVPEPIERVGGRQAAPDVGRSAVRGVQSWNLDRIDQRKLPLDGRFSYESSGNGVDVYLVGDGLRAGDPELAKAPGAGFDATGDGAAADCEGYGSMEAALIGGKHYGVATSATLVPVQVSSCSTGLTVANVVAGLDWVAANHDVRRPAVALISQQWTPAPEIDAAVNRLIADRVVVVVSSGSATPGDPEFGSAKACDYSPQRVPGAITVAGVNRSDTREPSYSNFGSCVDLYAPGRVLTTMWLGGRSELYEAWGQFYGAAQVAGTAAAYLSGNKRATPAQVRSAIVAAATPGVVKQAGTNTTDKLLYAPTIDKPASLHTAHELPRNGALLRGESITSPNGFYSLTMRGDGNLALSTLWGKRLWTVGSASTVWFGNEGCNLVARDYGRTYWFSGRRTGITNCPVRLQDDGNLVMYSTEPWSTGTTGRVPPAQPGPRTDRAEPNRALYRQGQLLISANDRYRAYVRGTTGQLVVRDMTAGRDLYATPKVASDWLSVQSDGNLVLYSRNGKALWSAGSGGRGAGRLVMRDNGVLSLVRTSDGRTLWSSTQGRV